MSMYICLSACLSVCLSAHITRKLHYRTSNFYARCLWPWLGPLLMALRYVMYFRFYRWRHVFIPWHQWADGLRQDKVAGQTYKLQVITMRQGRRGEIWYLWLTCLVQCSVECLFIVVKWNVYSVNQCVYFVITFMFICWTTIKLQATALMLATVRIAAEHGSFNRIRQVALICAPSNTWFIGPTRFCPQNDISIGSRTHAQITLRQKHPYECPPHLCSACDGGYLPESSLAKALKMKYRLVDCLYIQNETNEDAMKVKMAAYEKYIVSWLLFCCTHSLW